VVLNLGPQSQVFESTQVDIRGHVVLSTHLDRVDDTVCRTIALRRDEGVIVMLE
jgi:hypothetical protein